MFIVCKSLSKLAKVAATLTTAAFLAACEPGAIGGGPSINTSEPVPVALLIPRGSGQSGDAALA
ncbi:MAG: penicillin-binding protein activator, partial [Pseudomonadota bacterium]